MVLNIFLSVKPAVFDLFLTATIASYITVVYFAIQVLYLKCVNSIRAHLLTIFFYIPAIPSFIRVYDENDKK